MAGVIANFLPLPQVKGTVKDIQTIIREQASWIANDYGHGLPTRVAWNMVDEAHNPWVDPHIDNISLNSSATISNGTLTE